jgi:ASPM-SPD-2-Hydin domain-containing protein
MRNQLLIATAVLALSAAKLAHGQSTLQFSAATGGTSSSITSGARLSLTATDIGQVLLATVAIRNSGSGPAYVSGVSVSGTSEMTLASPPAFPVTINPNGNASFSVQYVPVTGNQVTAQVTISFVENGQPGSFQLSVTGTSPRLVFTYSVASAGGVTELSNGDNISFPATNVGTSTTAIVNVANRGTAPAIIQSLIASGPAYKLSGASGPLQLAPGGQTSFFVIFTPQAAGGNQGLLGIVLANTTISFGLGGTESVASFTLTYALADGNVRALTDGTTITFPATDAGGSSTATIEIQSQGPGTVSGVVVSGTGFRLTGLPLLPATVNTGNPLRFGIVFAPQQAGSFSGTFRINLSGRSISGTLATSTAASNPALAYIEPDTNNTLPLRDGATLTFPSVVAGTSASVTMLVNNNGAGIAVVDSIVLNTAAPAAFQLINLPALPASAPSGQQVRFGVRFSPQRPQSFTGTLLVSINGRLTTIYLQAESSGAQFTYSYGDAGLPLSPGSSLPLGDVTLGQSVRLTIVVTNTGNADGQVASITASGAGFALSDLPALPFTVNAGGSQIFTLNYAPTQPGPVTGRLLIGRDNFTLTGTAIGPRLIYSYTNAAAASPVADGGTVIFPPAEVGKSQKLQFAIQNTGTSSASIATINMATPGTAFALEQLPGLPFNLDAGATATFVVNFTPGNIGGLTGTLRVNNSSFTLSGNGTQPASLPSYQFQTPAGIAQPAQQPAIGLTLASPYPVTLDGTLKLTFLSTVFTDDPAIQFASGGRTINFTIPANSTRALFNGNPSIPLQTGTTAGSIVITPSFAMRSGFDMTPPVPEPLTITIPRAAPQVLTASITSQTANSFILLLNGYSTTRAMRQLEVQFNAKQGESFSTTKLTVDLSSAAATWFQSALSQTAGGSFLAAIPFVLQNGSSDDLIHRLQSLSVTATNDAGVSAAVTVPIP